MKKRLAAVLAAAILCVSVLTACSQNGGQTSNPGSSSQNGSQTSNSGNSSQGSAPVDLLSQIKERGEIIVAMEGTWAPCIDPATTQVAIPMRKGGESAALLAAINEALAGMAEDGTLTRLSMKYFGTDISKDQ